MQDWLAIAGGLAVLMIGAELLIRGSTELARRLGLSELLIGLTLVGFGTSTPELVSSLQAALQGSPGIAVGNVVGSNIANVLLILGASALIAPIAVQPKAFRRDSIVLVLSVAAAIGAVLSGSFSRAIGAAYLVALALYVVVAFLNERARTDSPETQRHESQAAAMRKGPRSIALDAVFCVAGLGLLMVGARFLVDGAVSVAASLGVSETIIGLTIVAVGTSMPEFITSVAAALRGKSDLALGNIVGSNIYNVFGILGVTALVAPIEAPADIMTDVWVMAATTALLIVFGVTGRRLTRVEGLVFVLAYAAYVAFLIRKATL